MSLVNRVRRFLARPPVLAIAYSERYAVTLPGSPLDPLRGEKILASLDSQRSLRRVGRLEAPVAELRRLLAVHDLDYLARLEQTGSMLEVAGLTLDDHQRLRVIAAQRAMVGGTLAATRFSLKREARSVNLGGGLHHARRDRGGGFCLFHDIAIAIDAVRREGFAGRVLLVDLDLHDGDGSRLLYREDPRVFTYSIHNRHWAPTEAVASLSLELEGDVDDDRYLRALRETLPEVVADHRPDLVFYLAGTDVAAGDPLGNWSISSRGMLERDRTVFDLVGPVPLVITLAGGYGSSAWRPTARALSLLIHGEERAPLDTEAATLHRYRERASRLGPAELADRGTTDDPDDWGLTEADLIGVGIGSGPHRTRFLDFYTVHGIELALETNGILDRLRDLGYARPTLECELDPEIGQTLRVFGEPARENLLIELRADRDRTRLAPAEILFVEWLLLQHPKGSFTPARPRLPGQTHPGLGLLRDAMALLVVVCDRLDLEGIGFVPSHFHLAAQSHRHLNFVDPAAEAQIRSMERSFPGVPLPDLARQLDENRIVDEKGAPSTFVPRLMLLPTSDRLRQRFGPEYEERVRSAMQPLSLQPH